MSNRSIHRRLVSLALGGAALVTVSLASPAQAQILYNTTAYTGAAPGSATAAIAAFDGLAAQTTGYGCTGLTTLNGVHNGGTFPGGSTANLAYHESVVFTVPDTQVGSWSFRWGVDFGLGGTLLVDGVELQSRWTDMWWNDAFTDPTEYLSGSANLTAGPHIVEVFGFEACCDGTGNAQFLAPGSTDWQDINTTNLAIAPNVCGSPGLLLTASPTPSPVLAGKQLTYTFFYESTGSVGTTDGTIVATIPANSTYSGASSGGVYDPVGGTVTWSVGALGVGASGNVTLAVTVNAPLVDGTVLADTASFIATGATTATATTNVIAANALLSLTSTSAPDPVAAGGQLTITLAYANTGSGLAPNATVTDVIPANTTFVSSTTNGATYDSSSNRVTFPLGDLGMGAAATVAYAVQVGSPIPNGTVLTDMASFSATYNATVGATSMATVTSTPSLTLTDTPAPSPVAAGAMLVYTLGYANTGSDAANGATVSWALPANVMFQSASAGGTYDSTSNQVTWSVPTIPAGGSGSVTATVVVASPIVNGTVLTDAAALTAPSVMTVMANATVNVTSAPLLTLTETGAPNPVAAGAQLVYTLSYGNAGTDTATTATISAAVPANTTFVSATGGGTFDSGTGTVTFPIGSLAAGMTGTQTFTVAVAAPLANGTMLSASASFAADGVAAVPAMAMTTVASAPTLSLTNTGAPNPLLAGAQLTYTLAYANKGTDVAHGVTISDTLAANTSFVSADSSGSYDSGANSVTWTIGDVAASGNGAVSFVVAVDGNAPAGTLSNSATLTASNAGSGITAMAMTMVNSATMPDGGADAGPDGGGMAGTDGGSMTGSGGSMTGSGGSSGVAGSGGSSGVAGSGGSMTGTAGSSGAAGSGGSSGVAGSGGSMTGSGGSSGVAGSGGSMTGSGGSSGATGSGGSMTGSGGSATTGTGGSSPSGTGGAAAGGHTGNGGAAGAGGNASSPSSGCDCAVATAPSSTSLFALGLLMGLMLVSRRRRALR